MQGHPFLNGFEIRHVANDVRQRSLENLLLDLGRQTVGVRVGVEEPVAHLQSAELLPYDAGERGAHGSAPDRFFGDGPGVKVDVFDPFVDGSQLAPIFVGVFLGNFPPGP